MSDEAFKLETDHSWSSELFWPQTTTASDDICICCGNLRIQDHKLYCRLAKVADNHDRMATMLRRLEWAAWEGPDSCCPVCHEWKTDGHDPACDLATLLKDLP